MKIAFPRGPSDRPGACKRRYANVNFSFRHSRPQLINFTRPSVALSFAIALAACAKSDERTADSTPITTSSSTGTTQQTEPVNAAPAPPTPAPATGWVVTDHGIGNLRAGMTVAEARAIYPSFKIPKSPDSAACTYATMDGLPQNVGVMVEGGKVVRVEVRRSSNVATTTGARIGDSEEKIKSLYPSQVTVSPHKYTDGHYLNVVPTSKADSSYRIIFETDGKKVLRYHAGVRPQVEYVEGCS